MGDMGKNGTDGCSLVRQGEVALVVVDDERDAKLDERREVRRVKKFFGHLRTEKLSDRLCLHCRCFSSCHLLSSVRC